MIDDSLESLEVLLLLSFRRRLGLSNAEGLNVWISIAG